MKSKTITENNIKEEVYGYGNHHDNGTKFLDSIKNEKASYSWCYLHGLLMDWNEYDCCYANILTLSISHSITIRNGQDIFLVKVRLWNQPQTPELGLVLWFPGGTKVIVSPKDIPSLKEYMKETKKYNPRIDFIFHRQEDLIRESYPEAHKILFPRDYIKHESKNKENEEIS